MKKSSWEDEFNENKKELLYAQVYLLILKCGEDRFDDLKKLLHDINGELVYYPPYDLLTRDIDNGVTIFEIIVKKRYIKILNLLIKDFNNYEKKILVNCSYGYNKSPVLYEVVETAKGNVHSAKDRKMAKILLDMGATQMWFDISYNRNRYIYTRDKKMWRVLKRYNTTGGRKRF